MRKIIILIFMCAALTALGSCLPREEDPLLPPVIRSYDPAPPYTVTVKRGEMVSIMQVSPNLRPLTEQSYNFSVSGFFVEAVYVNQGDTVQAGDLLAKLDVSDLEIPIADAEFDVRKQQLNYEFTGRSNAAETQLNIAKRKLTTLKEQLAARYMYAEDGGTVNYVKAYAPDARSTTAERVISIVDVSEAAYAISGTLAQYLTAGETYTLSIGGKDYEATAVSEGNAMVFYPDVPLDLAAKYATITFEVERLENVLYLPTAAVKFVREEYAVYVLNDAGIKTLKPIEIGMQATGKIQILSGLEEGDEVIVE